MQHPNCRRGHDITKVGRYNGKRDGYGPCKACNLINAADSRKRRREWLQALKIRIGCSICGYTKCPEALDFHHTDNDKEFNISSNMFTKLEKLKEEIDKCILVCRNCHAELHFNER
jgi:hypothetical protein